jgi:hypothetical protein
MMVAPTKAVGDTRVTNHSDAVASERLKKTVGKAGFNGASDDEDDPLLWMILMLMLLLRRA